MDGRRVFLEIVERGSYTEAAKRLGISVSYASRQVRGLEAELGVSLLARTTRRVETTSEGSQYAERLAPLLRGLDALEEDLSGGSVAPRGLVRVAVPLSFGLSHVAPLISSFLVTYPDVRVEASFSDRRTDPLDFDVTLRGGSVLADSAFTARRATTFRSSVVASPDYLARRGAPASIADLAHHDAITYAMSGSTWIFPTSPSETRVEVRARYQVDNGDAIADAAIAGLGVAYQPDFILGPRVASGALVRLLPGVPTFEGSFWVLTPTRRRSAATAAFVEHLIAGLDDPGHQQQIVVR